MVKELEEKLYPNEKSSSRTFVSEAMQKSSVMS